MKRRDGLPDRRGSSHRWRSEADGVGPQGAALILELQRLRQAFELEEPDEPEPHHLARTRARAGPNAGAWAVARASSRAKWGG